MLFKKIILIALLSLLVGCSTQSKPVEQKLIPYNVPILVEDMFAFPHDEKLVYVIVCHIDHSIDLRFIFSNLDIDSEENCVVYDTHSGNYINFYTRELIVDEKIKQAVCLAMYRWMKRERDN